MTKKKLHIQVPSSVVRNENFTLSNGDFLLYTRLCFLYFRNYQDEIITIDHKKLMLNIGITDTRTFKKRLLNLYENGLIRNKIDTLPRRKEIEIHFNSNVVNECNHFTMMNANVFNLLDRIDEHSFRLLFYYKSHINYDDKERDRSFCFVSIPTLKDKLKMGSDTIKSANELLVERKLVTIKKHKLNTSYEYDDNDELIFNRYNNHYTLHHSLF